MNYSAELIEDTITLMDNVNGEKVNLPNQYYLKNYNELIYSNR